MAAVAYLDTHVVAWLHGGETKRFSKAALARVESSDLLISPVVLLELEYLFETKRATEQAERVVEALASSIGLRLCPVLFETVVRAALRQSWTRDPFDRVIVAQAAVQDAPLITKDRSIRRHYASSVW